MTLVHSLSEGATTITTTARLPRPTPPWPRSARGHEQFRHLNVFHFLLALLWSFYEPDDIRLFLLSMATNQPL